MMRGSQAVLVVAVVVACLAQGVVRVAADHDCMPLDWDTKVAVGDTAFLCLRFNNRTQAVFTPKVDEYTQLSVRGSNDAVPDGTGIYDTDNHQWVPWDENATKTGEYVIAVHPVVYNVAAGFWKTYKKWKNGFVVTQPIVTVIVIVDEGTITGVTYDDGCYFCPSNSDSCVLDTFVPDSNSILQNNDYKGCVQTTTECSSSDCDLNMYVVWSGTDKNGVFMRSAGMRFSRFRAFGVEGLYDSAVQTATSEATTVSNAVAKTQRIAEDNT